MNRLIALGAAAYAGIGVAALAAPARVPALFGGRAETADARTEVRAVYGGLPLAIAGTLVVSPRAAVPMAVLSAGMAAGRLAGVRIETEPPSSATRAFVGIESALALTLLAGAAGERRARRRRTVASLD